MREECALAFFKSIVVDKARGLDHGPQNHDVGRPAVADGVGPIRGGDQVNVHIFRILPLAHEGAVDDE